MWKTLRQVAKGTTFYYKQFNLFLVLVLIGVGIFFVGKQKEWWIATSVPKAATDLPASLAPNQPFGRVSYAVDIDRAGKLKVNNTDVSGATTFGQGQNRFLLVLVRDAPFYLNSIDAVVRLPFAVTDFNDLQPRLYAVHGVGLAYYKVIDSRTIRFVAQEVYEGSEVSIGFTFPQTYLSLTPLDRLRATLGGLSPQVWLGLGTILPAFTAFFLLFLLLKRRLSNFHARNKETVARLPAPLPPALLGALYHGQIGKREITATLFDLARRGFLIIHHGIDREITFGKGSSLFTQTATTLRPFEVFLLHQIFGDEGYVAKAAEVEGGLNSELFSSRMAMTMLNIYDAAVGEGYFVHSPNTYYIRYKIAGIFLFFVALVALVYGAFVLPEPAYILFLWAGMLAASLMVVGMTPGLPRRTKIGNQVLAQWMGFRNYLTAPSQMSDQPNQFFDYLPYAIVLDCEGAWIARWQTQALALPQWLSAEGVPATAEDYARSLVSVIDFFAQRLITARPPTLA